MENDTPRKLLAEQTLPAQHNKLLQKVVAPHIDSFNYFLDEGLERAVNNLDPMEVTTDSGMTIKCAITGVNIGQPTSAKPGGLGGRVHNNILMPSECRMRGCNYAGDLQVKLEYSVDDGHVYEVLTTLGKVPIMVKSNRCRLRGLSPEELTHHKEEPAEMGGYFIVNGNEKVIRLLVMPRRNYARCLVRNAFMKRGPSYTKYGVSMRCMRDDMTSQTNVLYYLQDGAANLCFPIRKAEYFIPAGVMLKALVETTDREIYEKAVCGENDTFLADRVELLVRNTHKYPVNAQADALAYLGERFRVVLGLPQRLSNADVGRYLIEKFVFVHVEKYEDKFNVLIHCIRRLYGLVKGTSAPDNDDSVAMQECLLPGQLYLMALKERLSEWLEGLKTVLLAEAKKGPKDYTDATVFRKSLHRVPVDPGKLMFYFLATGNLKSRSGMDLLQVSGFTIVAEKLNFFRYLSHFGCIHRGAFFSEMKTTTVRKLLPEGWGYLCPVHTPDGSPCGLLLHLAANCAVITRAGINTDAVPEVLASLGMNPIDLPILASNQLSVVLDGRVIGTIAREQGAEIALRLRHLKVMGQHNLPPELEIAYVEPTNGGLYPGLYLFSSQARFMRPVRYLAGHAQELIGSFEQMYLSCACTPSDVIPGVTTHQDNKPTDMLSVVAQVTPFSDFNQSPRNMYQCQMGKQTMGTPMHTYKYRGDNKLYRIQTPQIPIVRPAYHNDVQMDEYPQGTNAIVAVIAYTGYDMEDAMIINKSSYERGFGHGTVYKTAIYDLTSESSSERFCNTAPDGGVICDDLDEDGLPRVGRKLTKGSALYCTLDDETLRTRIVPFKGLEDATVDNVKILFKEQRRGLRRVSITLRVPRNPIIGDKFSSRHGQKGVLSQLYPAVNMPFSESGIQPDIIINPHAFPSRMTIGMLIESMAGKAGALHAREQDATPFTFSESDRAIDYFGELLAEAGFNFYGNEPMYSGITGSEFEAEIFFGVVYYQRLRHMVSDKFQVRSTGPIHDLTRQPIKGRKRAGGIRFGEMERDSMLSHGTSFLLQDRLMDCSDSHMTEACSLCGSILSPVALAPAAASPALAAAPVTCRFCGSAAGIKQLKIPYVFRYLAAELASMNIRMTLDIK